jgi:hypothetical protein
MFCFCNKQGWSSIAARNLQDRPATIKPQLLERRIEPCG